MSVTLHTASYTICICLAFYLWAIVTVNLDVNPTLQGFEMGLAFFH